MDLKMSRNENALWLSILLLATLTMLLEVRYLELLIYWVIVLLFVGNAKRVHSQKYTYVTTVVRRSMYIFPLVIPLIFHFKPMLIIPQYFWIIIGVVVGMLFILPKVSTWRIVLSNDYISLITNKSRFYYVMSIYTLIGGAISEELFFRYYILSLSNKNEIVLLNVVISAVFFMLVHYGTKWSSSFSKYDFIVQIVFGLTSAILLLFSGSIIPSIIAHLIYNGPHVIRDLKSLCFVKNSAITIIGSNKNA
ncbi:MULTISPECIES: CPBP family intramembrane glutamic endopeptidase [Bacillus cereus group]|uniref:CPBP family intramembrane metalloprotease n=1 Tax=Bacillus proteolyticus TaxID=2026192 RepID=A0ABV3IFF5_9BACI|nr:CPBP family intramembrane glutamic endopeptidase [Bacillus cereus group sp. N8]MBJ8107566.1 CPBP family intramembrane metalloprotease [Bacillus cereus group sp. N8]